MLLDKELNTGMLCIKYILVFFNFLFVVTGICLILVGWSINYIYFEYSEFLDAHFFSPGVLMIIIGILVFLVASFGCWGAYRESTCMITIFSVMLAVIFVLELSAGVSAYVLQEDIPQLLERTITEALNESASQNSSARMMDVLQSELHCCGVHSYKDWEGIYPQTNNSITLPPSCCDPRYNSSDSTCGKVYSEGCLPQLEIFIRESIILLAGTASTIALIQLIGVSFSCSLAKMIRMQKTERDRQRWEMREQLINSYTQGEWNIRLSEPGNNGYDNVALQVK
uniref:Tetraspanin n=1 Tax=Cuerna arida TaxID=1464854 RepID=A0A1B6GIS6_9HEMI